MDFTLRIYSDLLSSIKNQGFSFIPFSEYLSDHPNKIIVLRHDVDKLPLNSLEFAKIQAETGIMGTYYFRAVPKSWDESIIKEIAGMGHEVGYHYEDVSLTARRLQVSDGRRQKERVGEGGSGRGRDENLEKELADIAIESFAANLQRLREIAPIKTICMHGSPMSRWDSRLLWKYFNYHDFGIIGEPYFDINFSDMLYLTDTGRRWDGRSVNVRDKASGIGRQASGRKEGEMGQG
jgi:hypothetical protein